MDILKELYSDLLTKIEEQARRFIKTEFGTLQELWQFELELVKYQSELQKMLAGEKQALQELKSQRKLLVSTRPQDWLNHVQQLETKRKQVDNRIAIYRHAYKLSRQLGDALAWVFLKEDIMPLSEIPPNSRDGHKVSDEHGLKGLLAIAETLANSGAGFPILHDVTNCLRIGDITFYSPGEDPATIEVKTHLKGSHEGMISLVVETHQIEMNDNVRRPTMDSIPKNVPSTQIEDDKFKALKLPTQLEERLQRQIERMKRAKIWQSMPNDQPFELGDREEGIKTFMHSEEELHHWDVVQELAIKAKQDGLAMRVVDDAFAYVVIYRGSPIAYPWVRGIEPDIYADLADLPSYLVAGSLLYPQPEKNQLWVPITNKLEPSVLPFYLYPFPMDIIMDIMWGRLAIGVTVNLGKLIIALQNVGIEARLPKNNDEFRRLFLPASVKISLSVNKQALIELRNLHFYGQKIVHEFLSLKGFVEYVSQMAKIGIKRSQDKLAENDNVQN